MRQTAAGPSPRFAPTEEDTITELMEEHVEDLDTVETVPLIEFEVDDSVVYPHHGAGKVIRKEKKEILDHEDELKALFPENDR